MYIAPNKKLNYQLHFQPHSNKAGPVRSGSGTASSSSISVTHEQLSHVATSTDINHGNTTSTVNPANVGEADLDSKMRRSRTVPVSASLASGDGDGKQDLQQEENWQAQGNSNLRTPRPALTARRTPTTLPTQKNRSPTIDTDHAHSIQHHAATFPLPERAGAGKSSFEGAEGEGGQYGGGKEKKKGVSFLSRIIGVGSGSSKKQHPGSTDLDTLVEHKHYYDNNKSKNHNADNSNELSSRPEGMDAQLFSQLQERGEDVEGIEYRPKHPQPPPYIKFRSKFKKEREFDRVFLAQELQAGRPKPPRRRTASSINSPALQGTPLESDENAIWALEFSKDGKYLAAAGQDKVVRVWAVLSTPEERRGHEREEDDDDATSIRQRVRLEAPVFQKRAIREYEGHEGPIIDLSWSKNNFLLSASADKTVRLWHTSRVECLCTFKHTEHVHSVQFHPRDDRFFLAGSRDMKLRFWSIPDKSVAFWQQLNEIITAVAFTPDGKTAIAGTVHGVCNFYETEGLKYQTQIHVRSAYGKNAKPSKICSIDTINMSERERADVKLLISSNDSRIRLYNFRDKSLETKFKGHKSEERIIKAQFSDNGQYIVGGSEDKAAFIWSMGPSESEKPSQRPVEFFEATTSQTTCAILAPTKARQMLGQSDDPIYDLCNPPPVTLLSRSESVASSRAPSRTNSRAGTPRTTESPRKKAMESPAYLARSTHESGNIIVTASNTGVIRVYRQDCAFAKRKSSDDTSSLFTGKKPSSVYMARAMSRSSAGNRAPSRSDSLSTQPPQERIMTWRQGISSTHSLDRKQSDAKSARSISPNKSGYSFRRSGSIRRNVGNGLRQDSVDVMGPPPPPGVRVERASTPSLPLPRESTSTPSPRSKNGGSTTELSKHTSRTTAEEGEAGPSQHPQPQSSKAVEKETTPTPSPSPDPNPLWLQNGQSFLSWNMKEYASQALKKLTPITSTNSATAGNNSHLRPELNTQASQVTVISRLSSDGEHTSAEERELKPAETLKCKKCGGTVFKARNVKGGGQKLSCQRCGTLAS